MRSLLITILFIPLLAGAQKRENPTDSLKKYQKLAMRDLDSLTKYEKKPGWNVHYFQLSEKRRTQINYWMDRVEAEKRRDNH